MPQLLRIWTACLILLAGTGLQLHGRLPALIPFYDQGKWGYADSNGHVVIAPQWDHAGFFEDGRARVYFYHAEDPNVYCMIDEKGRYIIPPSRRWNGELYTSWQGAAYNAQGKDGGYGIIDRNNRELIPCIYDKPDSRYNDETQWSGTFRYDSLRKRYFCIAVKDSRFGIIDTANHTLLPFAYDGLYRIYNPADPVPPQFYRVIKKGRKGLVDTQNQVVVPAQYDYIVFDKQYPEGMGLSKGDHQMIANLRGEVMVDIPGHSAFFPIGSFIPVSDSQGRWGLVDGRQHWALPCVYANIWQQQDTLVVLKDSMIIAGAEASTRYHRYYSNRTLSPLSDWVPEDKEEATVTTIAPAPQPEMPAALRRIVAGNAIRPAGLKAGWFTKDDISWVYTCSDITGNLFGVKGLAQGNDTQLYIAMVDSQQHFIMAPRASDAVIARINSRDSLLEMEKGDRRSPFIRRADASGFDYPDKNGVRFAVADFDFRILIPYQSYVLQRTFRYHNQVYAYVITRPERSGGWVPHAVNAFAWYEMPKYNIVDTSGQIPEQLRPYYLTDFCLPSGLPVTTPYAYFNEADTFAGYFLAEHESGRKGIVSLDGTVQYPAVSFRYGGFKPMGAGFFIVNESDIEEESVHYLSALADTNSGISSLYYARKGPPYLVNAANEVLLDSLSVEYVSAAALAAPGQDRLFYVQPRTNIYPPEGFFLMDDKGRGYYGRLKTIDPKTGR